MATHSNTLAWEFHWHRSLVGYSPWVRKKLDTMKPITLLLWSNVNIRITMTSAIWEGEVWTISLRPHWSLSA